ncbi:MAG: FliA/WhiG family RNA polymerase sigma factor [Alicyclobacillus sp.]|nr:FliA/WhiG family RNA polymerase sigma factor [Alicyclobacillus sp.]
MNAKHQAYQIWNQQRRADQVRELLPLVYSLARRIHQAAGTDGLELGDLVHAGVIGLYKAMERFDPERGVPLAAFAVPWVRGSMLDELARHRRIPRGLRDKQRRLQQAFDRLAERLGREPTDAEVAAEVGVSVRELGAWYAELNWTCVFSLEDLEAAAAGGLADEREWASPAAALAARADREQLVQALQALSQREQQVLWGYYQEELTLREIGEVLGLSEAQVSRIRTRALARLRARLTEEG